MSDQQFVSNGRIKTGYLDQYTTDLRTMSKLSLHIFGTSMGSCWKQDLPKHGWFDHYWSVSISLSLSLEIVDGNACKYDVIDAEFPQVKSTRYYKAESMQRI